MAWAVVLLIYIVVPGAGLLALRHVLRTLAVGPAATTDASHAVSRDSGPPVIRVSVLWATYGAWLLVLLTALFWYWSGAASLGFFTLVLLAPVVTAGIAMRTWRERALSRAHKLVFWAAAAYPVGIIVLLLAIRAFAPVNIPD